MNRLTAGATQREIGRMIQLHAAQTLLLLCAGLILVYLVFRLLRPAPPRKDAPDRPDGADRVRPSPCRRSHAGSRR
jgi:hypothetical protein